MTMITALTALRTATATVDSPVKHGPWTMWVDHFERWHNQSRCFVPVHRYHAVGDMNGGRVHCIARNLRELRDQMRLHIHAIQK